MRYFSLFFIAFAVFISSCRKDFSTVSNFGTLSFSKDTVFLDTLFTNISSATYTLKVYNNGKKTISIPKITLKNGIKSKYRLNIDGIAGKEFKNIEIPAKDSIYIFVATTIDFTSIKNPLYTDKILFNNGNTQQNVALVTLVQDATFLFPNKNSTNNEIDQLYFDKDSIKIKGRFLRNNELTFTNEKPYVIYGYMAVPENKTLTVNAGAKLYFHKNSGLIITKNATLKINGTLDKKVTLEGDRLEHSFNRTPGQWGTIWMRSGSKNNEVYHTQIKNASIGLLVENLTTLKTNSLKIENSEIYNSSFYGILSRKGNIKGNNIVIGNSGKSCFLGTKGGNYNFTHCTFANYWNNGLRTNPAVHITNFENYKNNTLKTYDLKQANFTNCIITGSNSIEFLLDKKGNSLFNYNIANCLIKFNDINNFFTKKQELNFKDANHYQNNIFNKKPDFKDTSKSKFIIGKKSMCIGKAKPSSINTDIMGINRTTKPDIGAYQHIKFLKK